MTTVPVLSKTTHTVSYGAGAILKRAGLTYKQIQIINNTVRAVSTCAAIGAQLFELWLRTLIRDNHQFDPETTNMEQMIQQSFALHRGCGEPRYPSDDYDALKRLWNTIKEGHLPSNNVLGMTQCVTAAANMHITMCTNHATYALLAHLRSYLRQKLRLTKSSVTQHTLTLDQEAKDNADDGNEEDKINNEVPQCVRLRTYEDISAQEKEEFQQEIRAAANAQGCIWKSTKLRLRWLEELEEVDRFRRHLSQTVPDVKYFETRKFQLLPQYAAGVIFVRFDKQAIQALLGGRKNEGHEITLDHILNNIKRPVKCRHLTAKSFTTNGTELHVSWEYLHTTQSSNPATIKAYLEREQAGKEHPICSFDLPKFSREAFETAKVGLFRPEELHMKGVKLEHVVGVDPGRCMTFTTSEGKRMSTQEYYHRIHARCPVGKRRKGRLFRPHKAADAMRNRRIYKGMPYRTDSQFVNQRENRDKIRAGWKPRDIRDSERLRAGSHLNVSDFDSHVAALRVWVETYETLFKWYGSKRAQSARFRKAQAKQKTLDDIVNIIAPLEETVIAFGSWNNGKAAPVSSIRKYLARKRRVIHTDEHKTTKMCSTEGCVNEIKFPRRIFDGGGRNRLSFDQTEVLRAGEKAYDVKAIVYCQQCQVVRRRDLNAARNMKRVVRSHVESGFRPTGFCRGEEKKEEEEEVAPQSESLTTTVTVTVTVTRKRNRVNKRKEPEKSLDEATVNNGVSGSERNSEREMVTSNGDPSPIPSKRQRKEGTKSKRREVNK